MVDICYLQLKFPVIKVKTSGSTPIDGLIAVLNMMVNAFNWPTHSLKNTAHLCKAQSERLCFEDEDREEIFCYDIIIRVIFL